MKDECLCATNRNESLKAELQGLSVGPLKSALDSRDQAKAKLSNLQAALSGYDVKKTELRSTLSDLIKASIDSIGKGEKHQDGRGAEVKGAIVEVEALIHELEHNAIPAAQGELKAAQAVLDEAALMAFLPLKPMWEKQLSEIFLQAEGLFDLFSSATQEFFRSIGVKSPSGVDAVLRLPENSSKLRTFIENKIGTH
jgi:hypothetical protein